MAQETELKLSLHAQDLPRLLQHPLLASLAPQRQRLFNTYFDTPDLRLAQRRVAVRERRVGQRTLLTVKTAGTSVGGLSQRGEWEGTTQPGAPDFVALVTDTALAQELSALAGRLQPLFRTDFTRRSWLIEYASVHGAAQIEVALDQGQITTGHSEQAPDGTRSEAILELELELKSGPVGALFDLALTLAGADERDGDGGLWLMPADRSKAERGLALYLRRSVAPQKAPTADSLRPDMDALTAARVVLLGGLAHLQANLTGLLAAPQTPATDPLPDPEFVHQARVALRRLRAVLSLFRQQLPTGFAEHWSGEWKGTAAVLGEARNWDVLDDRLLQWLTESALQGHAPEPMEPLAQWLLAQRQAAHQRVVQHVQGAALAHQLLGFAAALQSVSPAQAPTPADDQAPGLVDWATQTLRQRQRKLLKLARQAHTLDLPGLHALRIRFKKLRYAQQCLQTLLPPELERGTPLLVQVQEELGELNDLVTALDLLQDCALPGAQAWRRHLHAQQARALRGLPRLQRALSRMPTVSTD